MKMSSHLRNFYQVFSVVACPYLNLGVKSAQNCNADVSDPDERATANLGPRFLWMGGGGLYGGIVWPRFSFSDQISFYCLRTLLVAQSLLQRL